MELQIKTPLKQFIKAVVPRPMLNWAILKTRDIRNNFHTAPTPEVVEDAARTAAKSQAARIQFLSIDWLKDNLKEAAAKKEVSYFISEEPNSLLSICTTEANYLAVAQCIFELASENELTVDHVKKKPVRLKFQDAFIETLQSHGFVQLRLSDGARRIRFRIEKWNLREGELAAPRPHMATRRISIRHRKSIEKFLTTPGATLTSLYNKPLEDTVDFDIDVVYTWVDSEDPEWAAMYAKYRPEPAAAINDAVSMDRFVSREELKFSLRSIAEFAPWVRRVYIVSNCKPPEWLNVDGENIVWVPHEDIIEEEFLPTFSSHAIESALHNVPGMAEHFLYFNDDLFLAQPIKPTHFFLPNGLAKIRLEPYGAVHGKAHKADADFMNAARNGQALLQGKFGKTATALHTHAPYALLKSVMKKAEKDFAEPWKGTRAGRFRSETDVSPTSFLSPHYAYMSGAAIKADDTARLIKKDNSNYKAIMDRFLASRRAGQNTKLPMTYCLNDGSGSHLDADWNQKCVDFMDGYFPFPSKFEHKL